MGGAQVERTGNEVEQGRADELKLRRRDKKLMIVCSSHPAPPVVRM